jgi:hypothetical protein
MKYLLIHSLRKALLWFPRSASTATARAIAQTHYPELLTTGTWSLQTGLDEPAIKAVLPSSTSLPPGYQAAVILRHPLERFRSACAYQGISAAAGLQLLRDGKGRGYRLVQPIAALVPRSAKLFAFEQLDDVADWLEVPTIEPENAATAPAPVLTESETDELETIYQHDLALYRRLTDPAGPSIAEIIGLGEAHIANSGYSATRLLKLMDLRLSGSTNPKLLAVYAWTQQVAQLAATGNNTFPPAPYSFEEILTES